MAQLFTQKDLDRLRLVKIADGVYAKESIPKKLPLPKDFVQIKSISIKGRPSNSENPVVDGIESGPGWCRITLAGNFPGLNGKSGLLREHWAARKKRKEAIALRIAALNIPKFPDKVSVIFCGHSSLLYDWENHVARFKLIGDILVDAGILVDDSPKYIVSFIPEQSKCQRKDSRLVITIKTI